MRIAPGVAAGAGAPAAADRRPVRRRGRGLHARWSRSRCRRSATAHGVGFVFKSSFDKANRSSGSSARGPGLEAGLEILARVKAERRRPGDSPTSTRPGRRRPSPRSSTCCRSRRSSAARPTCCVAAARDRRGRSTSRRASSSPPAEMANVVGKLREAGAAGILLTERGTTFGYNNLVVDFRSLPQLRALGCPVVFDATHSVQLPGGARHQLGRPARVRPAPRPRRGRGRHRRAVRGGPPRPRHGAERRAEHAHAGRARRGPRRGARGAIRSRERGRASRAMSAPHGPRAVTFDFWNTLMWEEPGSLKRERLAVLGRSLRAARHRPGAAELERAHDAAHRAYEEAWRAGRQFRVEDAAPMLVRARCGLPPGEDGCCSRATTRPAAAPPCTRATASRECLRGAEGRRGSRSAIVCDIGLTPSTVVRELLDARRAARLLRRHDLLRRGRPLQARARDLRARARAASEASRPATPPTSATGAGPTSAARSRARHDGRPLQRDVYEDPTAGAPRPTWSSTDLAEPRDLLGSRSRSSAVSDGRRPGGRAPAPGGRGVAARGRPPRRRSASARPSDLLVGLHGQRRDDRRRHLRDRRAQDRRHADEHRHARALRAPGRRAARRARRRSAARRS